MDESTLKRIEEQRLALEENIAKLRKSLRHWQTLEIDYEGLKEEFMILPESAPATRCLEAAREFKPELIDDRELQSLIDDGRTAPKRPSQLVEILTKRADYVLRNIETVRKQLSDAERKWNVVALADRPEYQDDAGLPLREITEELDDDGNILSSKVQAPGAETSKLVDVLRKAGVADLPESVDRVVELHEAPVSDSVSEGAHINPEHDKKQSSSDILEQDTDESDSEVPSAAVLQPVNPNDTYDEAALRQEMLHYNLGEVGNIVAELELEDVNNMSYDEYDDEDEDLDSEYDEDEDLYSDGSEDEKGMTKRPVISDRYRRKMDALQKKLGIENLQNLGPQPELPEGMEEKLDVRPSAAEAARQAAIARYDSNKSALKSTDDADQTKKPKAEKKRVAFNEDLDIAPETKKPLLSQNPDLNPVGELVVERPTSNTISDNLTVAPSAPTKKVSRFKATRTETPQTPMFPPPIMDFPRSEVDQEKAIAPTGPKNKVIANTLVERAPKSSVVSAPDPNEINEEIHRAEVAIEYQKLRNRKIHEQGGYVRGGEQNNYGEEITFPPEEVEGEEMNDVKPKKMSRFKAARLQRS